MSARDFLKYFGLDVKRQVIDQPAKQAFDVVETSYRGLVARQHGPSRIKCDNIELRRSHFALKRVHQYDVFHVEEGFPVQQIGIFTVFLRAHSKKCLVILEPVKQ